MRRAVAPVVLVLLLPASLATGGVPLGPNSR
jgi:hypothetical protein